MRTQRVVYYKNLFIIGAIWNIAFALGFLFLPKWLFPLFSMQMPNEHVWLDLFAALVLVFGFGYYWVSRDLGRNLAVVGMGIIGKTFVFLILGYYWFLGGISTMAALAGVGDLIFAILFAEFLVHPPGAS